MIVEINYTLKGDDVSHHKTITLPNHYIDFMADNKVKDELIKELIDYNFTTEYSAVSN